MPGEVKNSLFFKKKKSLYNKLILNSRFDFNSPQNKYRVKNYYSSFFLSKSYNSTNFRLNSIVKDVRFNRIRFKPGYQNIWRSVRSSLKDFIGLKFLYQQQFTKYLARFYNTTNKYSLSFMESSVEKVILYSQLLTDSNTVNLFFQKKYIYFNSKPLLNLNSVVIPGDIIHLVVSLNYYITYNWLALLSKYRQSRFRYLVYKKGLSRRYKSMKNKKQSSYKTPNWVFRNRYDFLDIKSFMEVDYFTLSTILIYTPFLYSYYTLDNNFDLRVNTFRLYNWKYIT